MHFIWLFSVCVRDLKEAAQNWTQMVAAEPAIAPCERWNGGAFDL